MFSPRTRAQHFSDHSTKSGPCLLFTSGPCESGVVSWSEGTFYSGGCGWRVQASVPPGSAGEGICHQLSVQSLGWLLWGKKEFIHAWRIVSSSYCRNKLRVNPPVGGLLWQKLLFTAWKVIDSATWVMEPSLAPINLGGESESSTMYPPRLIPFLAAGINHGIRQTTGVH